MTIDPITNSPMMVVIQPGQVLPPEHLPAPVTTALLTDLLVIHRRAQDGTVAEFTISAHDFLFSLLGALPTTDPQKAGEPWLSAGALKVSEGIFAG
ncbi:hypothetical protein JUN65_02145 [Gluconacetobacter azotocaptans]|uniref:hypothetical protein n=1 Tax=Gluconacetobacter azotocaptans TaxID=142834 RepID=UPI00195A55C7|nr:hypothetical protein [Gluconacetobacter azotocaptans]MBM9400395.1 hypothetical protein [Gluconacetobacter azotocaptans]